MSATEARGTAVGDEVLDRLQEYVGRPYRPRRTGKDPVNEPMIRHLVEALGDENPVYTDAEAARQTVHGGIVAPPTSLQVWTMAGFEPWPDDPGDHQPTVLGILDSYGYTSVVATNCEQEYRRYLRPGDRVSVEATLESVVGPKATALGEGYFVTTLETYRDGDGEVVGTARFRILKFRPARRPEPAPEPARESTSEAPATAPLPRRPRPSTNADNAFFWAGIEAGELRIQRCEQCRRLRNPAQPACRECGSLEWDWIVASGRGEVFSWVVHHHPPLPGFEPPYAVAVVELDEGVRLVGELVEADRDAIEIGMPVDVVFTPVDDELTVPQWRPAAGPRPAEREGSW